MVQEYYSLEDFTNHYQTDKLGSFSFPNGRCGIGKGPFHISLRDLYKISMPLENILGIIVYGPAVRYDVHKNKTYKFAYGNRKKENENPFPIKAADFLAVTKSNSGERRLNPKLCDPCYGYYLDEGGINLISKSIDQIIKEVKDDNLTKTIFHEGVPVFYNPSFYERFIPDLEKKTGIKLETKRRVNWEENQYKQLVGRIG